MAALVIGIAIEGIPGDQAFGGQGIGLIVFIVHWIFPVAGAGK